MNQIQRCVCPHPEVVDTELDGEETVLLHLGSKRYFSLNATGTRLWRGLKKGLTPGDISQQFQNEFDVDEARADRAVVALITELLQHRLIRHVE